MPGRELLSSVRRHGARSVVALLCALTLVVLSSVLASPAGASGTDHAQLSMTGLVDDDNPTGGSSLAVKPGTSISFTASAAPTQKIKSLLGSVGLGSVLDSLLGSVTFQVKANFSGLPGGHKNTVLSGNKSVSFHFSSLGTYHFTYEAQSVGVDLLGQKKSPVALKLNGNQAKKLGVELNASNQYVGEIDVTKNPHGGISIQVPKTQVHPKVLGHQLPKVGLPGVTTPKIGNPVGSLINPKGGKGGTTTNPGKGGSSGSGGTVITKNQELPVPTQVMGSIGSGNGDAGSYYGSGSGGYYGSAFPDTSGGSGGTQQASTAGGSGSGGASVQAADEKTPAKHQAELAANRAPSAELPVVLAILAIVALSLVTATYARLFLLRRSS